MEIMRGKIDGKVIATKLKEALDSYSPEKTETQLSARQINKLIKELLSEDENILKEQGKDAQDLLFIKFKKRAKGEFEEKNVKEKLRTHIEGLLGLPKNKSGKKG